MRYETPRFLYKVMQTDYFRDAVLFGRLLFNLSTHIGKHKAANGDPGENKAEVEVGVNGDGNPMKYGVNSLIYCFTYDIDKYLSLRPLQDNEVVLQFKYEDVLAFFDYLGVNAFYHGYVSYGRELRAPMNIVILDKEAFGTEPYDHFNSTRYACLSRCLTKSKEFECECEYRFLALPPSISNIHYFVPDLNFDLPALFFDGEFTEPFKDGSQVYGVLHTDFVSNRRMRENRNRGGSLLLTSEAVISHFFTFAEIIQNKHLVEGECSKRVSEARKLKGWYAFS